MRIWANDIPTLYEQMIKELEQGNNFLAVNGIFDYAKKSDFQFFNSEESATDFSNKVISEFELYFVHPIAPVVETLQNILKQPEVHLVNYELNETYDIYTIDVYAIDDPNTLCKRTDQMSIEERYGSDFTNLALWEELQIEKFIRENNLLTEKQIFMNQENFKYLSDQIKFTGFGEGHTEKLKEKMNKGEKEFALFHDQRFGNDSTVATLQFKKSDQSDMYFFNRYNLMLATSNSTDPTKQTFYLNNKADNITLKEAYNLMSGRAVYKELTNKDQQKYNAWVQLDFKNSDKNGNYEMKKFHENYGFDLEKVLSKHPIKELASEEDKNKLLESLQRGNRQAVTLQHDGQEKKVFIEAAPQFKSLNFYDSTIKRVNAQSLNEKQGEGQTEKKEAKKETVKQDKAGSEEGGNTKKQSQGKSKRKGQSV